MKNQKKNKNKKTKHKNRMKKKIEKENGIKDIEPYIYANLEDKKQLNQNDVYRKSWINRCQFMFNFLFPYFPILFVFVFSNLE